MNSNVFIIINLTKIYSEKYHLINMNSANGLRCFSVDHFYSIEPNDFSYTYYRRLINNYQQEKNSFITVMLIESPISTRLVAKLKVLAYQNLFCFFVFLHPSDVKWDIDLSFLTSQQGYTILKYNPKNSLPQELHKVRIKAKAILNILAILSLGGG